MTDFFLSRCRFEEHLRHRTFDDLLRLARAAIARGGKMVVLDEREDGRAVVIEVVRTRQELTQWAGKLIGHAAQGAVPAEGATGALGVVFEHPRKVGGIGHLALVDSRTDVPAGPPGETVPTRITRVLLSCAGRVRSGRTYSVVGPDGPLCFAAERVEFDGAMSAVEGIRIG